MSARPTWKGVLKISLVTIPIKVFPATSADEPLHFNQLHAECQTRIQQKRWCPKCEKEVPIADVVKGFEFEPGKYVLVTEAEFDAVRTESTRVINLEAFADARALDPMYIDRSYYLAPGDAGAGYPVLAAALRDLVGIGKVALYGREYLVAVRSVGGDRGSSQNLGQLSPLRAILVLHTLHHAGELRPFAELQELNALAKARVTDVRVARQVIAALTGPLNLADFTDDYQAGLRRVIDGKVAGEEIVASAESPSPRSSGFVEDLRRSLAAVSAKKTRPGKVRPTRKSA